MVAKYVGNHFPTDAPVSQSHSSVWKWLVKVRAQADSSIFRNIGRGLLHFWKDCWLKEGFLQLVLNILHPNNLQVH